MAKSQTSEPQCPRTAIRDVPRRKAAPLGVGVFSEAKSPSVEKTLSLPPKKAPRKATTKKGKNSVTVKMETASLSSECELPPPKADAPEVVCETKTHGGKHDVGGERPPRKTLKKRGGRSPNESRSESTRPVVTLSRPRRHSAATSLSIASAQQQVTSRRNEGILAATTAESGSGSTPVADLGCRLVEDGKKIVQDMATEKLSTPEKEACTFRTSTSPGPMKRSRVGELEKGDPMSDKKRLRPESEPLKDRSPVRRFPSRRDTTIFPEKPQLGISSPLLIGRRLITS